MHESTEQMKKRQNVDQEGSGEGDVGDIEIIKGK